MIKSKQKYLTYEFIYNTQDYIGIIITAYVENKGATKELSIWLKTSDNMGLSHFVVGYEIEDDSELSIIKEIKKLDDNDYFVGVIEQAIEIENV